MIGGYEILLILIVTLLLFGGKKLPELARSLGKGIREFKRAAAGVDNEKETPSKDDKSPPPHG